jgi:Ser/Thr protein kinase RdoA (MazF antagonist)
LIVDVGIGASYLRLMNGNPLAGIAEFLAGYHSVTPLEIAEIDMLFDLVRTRLAASITILSWRASMRGEDDAYLAGAVPAEGSAARFVLRQALNESRLKPLPRSVYWHCGSGFSRDFSYPW